MIARLRFRVAAGCLAAAACVACVPRAQPLVGAPAGGSAMLPRLDLPASARRVSFNWRYDEQDGPSARGEGVATLLPPDTARLQLFLAGGFGGGAARLAGDQLEIPSQPEFRRLLPAAPLLWAAFGRLAVPPARDTTLRRAGDTLRADVGAAPTWRVTIVRDTLRSVERIQNGRVLERVDRSADHVSYRDEAERRSLRIDVVRDAPVGGG